MLSASPLEKTLNRRQLLKAGLAASLVCMTPWSALASYNLDASEFRSLSLYNTHTGEMLRKLVYWEQGEYLHEALDDINYLLRDHRSDQVTTMDPKVIDLMSALKRKFPNTKPLEIISGYRSPETNQNLRNTSSGVAKNSFHMQGRAVDLRIPGVPLKTLRKVALQLHRGGVGFYPKSDFVHVDTGPVRTW